MYVHTFLYASMKEPSPKCASLHTAGLPGPWQYGPPAQWYTDRFGGCGDGVWIWTLPLRPGCLWQSVPSPTVSSRSPGFCPFLLQFIPPWAMAPSRYLSPSWRWHHLPSTLSSIQISCQLTKRHFELFFGWKTRFKKLSLFRHRTLEVNNNHPLRRIQDHLGEQVGVFNRSVVSKFSTRQINWVAVPL